MAHRVEVGHPALYKSWAYRQFQGFQFLRQFLSALLTLGQVVADENHWQGHPPGNPREIAGDKQVGGSHRYWTHYEVHIGEHALPGRSLASREVTDNQIKFSGICDDVEFFCSSDAGLATADLPPGLLSQVSNPARCLLRVKIQKQSS